MGILSNPDHEPIVSWLPHGNGFMIHKKKEFAEEILPKYWKASKFTSFVRIIDSRSMAPLLCSMKRTNLTHNVRFSSSLSLSQTRKLNRWGFSRAPRGPETGAYFHKLFRRDKPELCLQMTSNSGNNKQHLSPTHQTAHLYPSMMPSQNPWFPMMMPPPMSPQQQLQQQQAMWQMQMWQMQQMQMMHGGGYGNPMEMKQEEGNNVDSNQELADPRMEPAAMDQPSQVNVE